MRKKLLLSIALAGIVSVASACGTPESGSESGSDTSQAPAEESAAPDAAPEIPEADLEGVPDVVAVVNGTEILKADFESVYTTQYRTSATQSQMSGEPVDQDELKTQTIDGMIGTELLVQEAGERGLEASDEAITAALDELVAANQLGSADEFYAALAEQGMDEATVKDQLATQVQVEQLIQEEAGDTAPSEEELTAAYDEAVAQQEEQNAQSGEETEVPPFEEAKPALEEQLKTQKESAAAETLVTSLREEADVTINL
ncbi:SurA N-terminal domain-containing protein [Arthrobacter sp. H20]|uniref:SurA N-terminal domain-containing protein n=1 Tax=Arthrobacter sp. H20 TaxID=1267981 RepID=UPI00047AB328|nr:SurA N-terminal domain-containing protein [Arthrobacter sp. H20]